MHILSMLLLALSSTLDNLGIGISYGLRRIVIPLSANLLIAIITSFGTFLSMTCGELIANYLDGEVANIIGAAIIALTGVWIVCLEQKKNREKNIVGVKEIQEGKSIHNLALLMVDQNNADLDNSGHISNSEAIFLGLALILNNIPAGVGAGISRLSPIFTTVLVFLLSIATLGIGTYLGKRLTFGSMGEKAGIVGGILLILLGIYELLLS